jgi:hypothetical protein
MTMNIDADLDMIALRRKLEAHFISGTPLEVIYFGGGLPGVRRNVTPLRYCEERGWDYIIGLCHKSGIEKTFKLDRMHLPSPPLVDGKNDFRILSRGIGNVSLIEDMLGQIARLGNLPMENALAAHHEQGCGFESFFDEYSYGGYTLELEFTSTVIYLSLGYEADTCETIHYEFTPESEPRLTPKIATHYSLYTGKPAPDRSVVFEETQKMRSDPRPHVDYSKPETTPGVFLEHFDLSCPLQDGLDGIVYGHLFRCAKEAASTAGWIFRSYSSLETPGTDQDWRDRNIRAFPMLILYRNGIELGRHPYVCNTGPGIIAWGNQLLGIET